jgi:hypothetical protein
MVNGDDALRNRCAVFAYKYAKNTTFKARFVDGTWLFAKFVAIVDVVKETELSIYLDVLAYSLGPTRPTVSDADVDALLQCIAAVIGGDHIAEAKLSAAFLWCSLMAKDAESCLVLNGPLVFRPIEDALSATSPFLRKRMAVASILFIRATNGAYNSMFNNAAARIYSLVFEAGGKLSRCKAPLLFGLLLKYEAGIDGAEQFTQRLMAVLSLSEDEWQVKIAAVSLKQFLYRLDRPYQMSVVESICARLPEQRFTQYSLWLLRSLLKDRVPLEHRLEVAAAIVPLFEQITPQTLVRSVGAYCSLAVAALALFGPDRPAVFQEFFGLLLQQTQENPSHFLHYAFFFFGGCSQQAAIDTDSLTQLIADAFAAITETKSPIDLVSALRFLVATFSQSLEYLTEERFAFLLALWDHVRQATGLQSAADYLALGFMRIASHTAIDLPLFVSALEYFPPRAERCLTVDMCGFMLKYFGPLDTIPPEIRLEALRGIIRLLATGLPIRYCYHISLDHLLLMVKLGHALLASLAVDASIIAEVLPDRPRKQAVVLGLFQEVNPGPYDLG